jgi:SulP family sulfate permease
MRLEDTLVPSVLEKPKQTENGWKRFFPIVDWLTKYEKSDFSGDFIAGLVVAIMLIPQAMAYSNLAALPPQLGLYSSIVTLILFSFFTTSRFLSIGPVAIVSILIAAGIGQITQPGTAEYISLAVTLAFLVGIIQFIMGFFQIGFIVNFISHPVISGFISASAVTIFVSQLKGILGLTIPYSENVFSTFVEILPRLSAINLTTLAIGLFSVFFLLVFPNLMDLLARSLRLSPLFQEILKKSSPLLLVFLCTFLAWFWQLNEKQQVSVVGQIPSGFPGFFWPHLSLTKIQSLLPIALAIAFVGFMESYSVATTLGSRRGQKVDPNQELLASGLANVGATFVGGYAVTGSFSRSMVNFSSGASSQISSLITAVFMVAALFFLMSFFYFLPIATLAAIILVAVKDLFDAHGFKQIWHYSRADGYSWLVTFFSILIFNIQIGILIGAIAAITLYLWRTSQPHVVVVGRVGDTEHFRSVSRYDVKTYPTILAIRIDENLYFANTKYLEDYLFYTVMETGQIKHLVIIMTGVNFIDVSALDTLEKLVIEMKVIGIKVYLAEIKGRLMDKIGDTDFLKEVGEDKIFLTAHEAMSNLGC